MPAYPLEWMLSRQQYKLPFPTTCWKFSTHIRKPGSSKLCMFLDYTSWCKHSFALPEKIAIRNVSITADYKIYDLSVKWDSWRSACLSNDDTWCNINMVRTGCFIFSLSISPLASKLSGQSVLNFWVTNWWFDNYLKMDLPSKKARVHVKRKHVLFSSLLTSHMYLGRG
jgi:hypothetical protein